MPTGVPNEVELLNPVGAIPHSGDSGRNGRWTLLLLIVDNVCTENIQFNIHSAQLCGVYALELYSSSSANKAKKTVRITLLCDGF